MSLRFILTVLFLISITTVLTAGLLQKTVELLPSIALGYSAILITHFQERSASGASSDGAT